ncbi:uncharacterized protein PGTG_10898 [Puccinia graminis f. sp. tritici CRL 75-36-700-3]|uniref:FFD box profile domain-containing protein n=1 Tax=Puccinia graminis f. sp. tritici (strain CRL 75-36-700-3 / race SCCL) TaxID=418459 RepID=E3KKB4_PUCGT|nr:uncharacterized protein PGTG_10898 [Puccinia graminis f. sp. tritici CRL 75-36-700-3]EFP84739.1 hypothetical protein PGTG_10898 [Puccinia graminis f. sp. tritici CRL 75-36-700-3]
MAQQYIGSRISLISKSDIRYRGILHSIDPAASTVSLEQVRSMGTEGRKSNPSEEIAATDQLYEFIVFRAADVKDLSIEAPAEAKPEPPKPSVPDDPAIMSTTAPPRAPPNPYMQQNIMGPPQGMYNNTMPPMMYPPGNVPPQWPPYGMPPPGQIHPMMGFPPQPMPPPNVPLAQQPNHQSNQTNVPPSTKPNPAASAGKAIPPHKVDATGSALNQKASPLASLSPNKPSSSLASNPLPPSSAQSSGPGGPVLPSSQPARGPAGVNGAAGSGKSVFGTTTAMDMMASIAAMSPQQGSPANQQASSTSQKFPTNSANIHPNQNGTQGANYAQSGALQPSTSQSQQQHQMRHPLPQVPNNNKAKAAPKAHGASQPNNSNRPNHHHQSSSTPIVPAQDFDFASANAKFNKAAPPSNSIKAEDGSSQKEDVEPGLGAEGPVDGAKKIGGESKEEDDFVIPEAPPGTYYDKKKSFFDDISSEVKERSALSSQDGPSKPNPGGPNGANAGRGARGGAGGRGGRGGKGWDRNAERQKNLDTFGEVALNPNLGALGSGYNGYGRGGAHRMGQIGGAVNGGYRGMPGRGRGGPGRGNHHHHHNHHHHNHPAAAAARGGFPVNLRAIHLAAGGGPSPVNQ